MSYSVQTNHSCDFLNPIPDDEWETVSSDRAGHQEFDNLDGAIKAFELNASMARMVWPMRLIDSNGLIIRYYNSELDERLPGCLGRLEERAYYLWQASGCSGPSKYFWLQAKRLIEQETSNLGRFLRSYDFTEYGDLVVLV